MLLEMVQIRSGRPAIKTRSADAAAHAAKGYEGIVLPVGLGRSIGAETEAEIGGQVAAAEQAGMKVFLFGQGACVPREEVAARPGDFLCEDASGRLCLGKDDLLGVLRGQIQELFERWPAAAGIIVEAGEGSGSDAGQGLAVNVLAGLGGSCPICGRLGITDRLVRLIAALHAAAADMGKLYVHRVNGGGRNGPGFSVLNDRAGYLAVSSRLPMTGDLRFAFPVMMSSQAGGRRLAELHPCLLADERKKWIEFSSEQEFEGRGAFPNYRVPLWIELLEHLSKRGGMTRAEALERYGFWGWSRGLGWGGPHVQREEWIDANVRGLALMHQRPDAQPEELATAWAAEAFGVAESSPPAPAIAELLMISPRVLDQLVHVRLSGEERPLIRDDLIDVETIWTAAGLAVEQGAGATVIEEQRAGLAGVDRIRELFDIALAELPNKTQGRDMGNTLAFYSSFAGMVSNLVIGFVLYLQWVKAGRVDEGLAERAQESLQGAQKYSQLHAQRHALLPGVPSVFHDNSLWERTNACLGELAGE